MQGREENPMLNKMKNALNTEEVLSADIAKYFTAQILKGRDNQKLENLFKDLTMLTQWYQESIMEIQGQKAETRVLLVDKNGTIEINRFEHSAKKELFGFSDLFNIDTDSSGNLRARYKKSYKNLQGREGYSVTIIEASNRTKLEEAYLKALERAERMKSSFYIDGKKTSFQTGTGALIPVNTSKGIKYYKLSSLGDLSETYLRLQSQKDSFKFGSEDAEEQLAELLEGTYQVDNTSALLRGDFAIGDKKQIQVSAKAEGASAFGISQVVNYIYNLRALVESNTPRTKTYDNSTNSKMKFLQWQNENDETPQKDIEIPKHVIDGYVKELFGWAQ